MKTRMKQLSAVFLALAMVLSMSVSAFAGAVNSGGSLPQQQTDSSTVASEGKLPDDLVDVIMPTAVNGHFTMIFDSHGMLYDTKGDRFRDANSGKGIADPENSRFFFKNYTTTPIDTVDKLLADETGEGMKKDDEVVVYKKAATSGGLTSIYAQVDTDGKLVKWLGTDGNEVAAAAWEASGAYEKIASLKDLDPASGYGLDEIDNLNKKNPTLYLYKVGPVSNNTTTPDLNGTVQYSFIGAYDNTDPVYVAFKEADGSFVKAFSALTPTAISGAAAPADYAGVTGAKFTNNSVDYFRQRTNQEILSLKKTSAPVQVINKTNAAIGVSMKAELTNLPSGDGKVDANGKQTYVYAKAISTDADGTIHFYDGPVGDASTKEITGVPTLYLTLKATDNAATPNTTTEVMEYDSTATKAVVSVGTSIAGKGDYFEKKWEGTENSGKYVYQLKDESYSKRKTDFNSLTFMFEGTIDKDDEAWDTFDTTNEPAVSVTWGVESFKALKDPTVDKPASIKATMATAFKVSDNPDKAVFVKLTQGGTEIAASNITVTNGATGTSNISVAKGVITGTADLVFTFKDPQKDFRTTTVTLKYT